MFNKGSTAVLSTPDLPFIVAVKQAGIYSFEDGDWFLQYGLTQNIYKLVQLGHFIFGIGDNGTIIRYDLQRKKWNQTSFPTAQRLWDITGNQRGYIVTHGGSCLYISANFGSDWSVLSPFQHMSQKPLIRSLLYHQGSIYIGTQINSQNGGLWRYDVRSGELQLIKKEKHSMISSIYRDENDLLIIAKGNARSGMGTIEMLNPFTNRWGVCQQQISERAFLDIFEANEKVYATTSQDEDGFSRIYEVHKSRMYLIPIETVAGHGFRGAGFDDQLFICSHRESKWISHRYNTTALIH
ncbi:hypothetical protein DFO70_101539 [Cytobacillus firmus]|uniref:BNR repeat-containing protein n=2 Tax=Cytobacillus TaxID=2675230 RepID=A0A366K6H0_CYTFI|nr:MULTISPECIES: hypothetical protein [Cytobacillus]RBP96723.1 hypothetical protein DFO70_101539 [Cytobacillus firmus]TDX45550.1 hypothetical protein DFO72_10218 [Cytobacillus oceanisediminis]